MKIIGEIGITRDNRGVYYIRLEDSASSRQFVEVKLTAKQFAEAVTGLYVADVEMSVQHLDKVGKQRVRESRQVLCPLDTYDKDTLAQWLRDNCQEEGWMVEAYLGSQNSIKSVDGGKLLNYAVIKFVDVE